MGRMTWKRDLDGYEDVGLRDGVTVGDAICRLASYEDTGLEPEEITTKSYGCVFYCNRKCNLDGDFCAEGPGCPYEIGAATAKHMLDLTQAERDGRLVMPPCKVGDIVWTNMAIVGDRYRAADRPYPIEVVFIGMEADKCFFHGLYSNGRVFPFDFDRIGKTVFLAREEAEAVLKRREETDNEAEQ